MKKGWIVGFVIAAILFSLLLIYLASINGYVIAEAEAVEKPLLTELIEKIKTVFSK